MPALTCVHAFYNPSPAPVLGISCARRAPNLHLVCALSFTTRRVLLFCAQPASSPHLLSFYAHPAPGLHHECYSLHSFCAWPPPSLYSSAPAPVERFAPFLLTPSPAPTLRQDPTWHVPDMHPICTMFSTALRLLPFFACPARHTSDLRLPCFIPVPEPDVAYGLRYACTCSCSAPELHHLCYCPASAFILCPSFAWPAP
ncbi:hypothetical protein MRX96_002636 [Rhipicephalus microplus]